MAIHNIRPKLGETGQNRFGVFIHTLSRKKGDFVLFAQMVIQIQRTPRRSSTPALVDESDPHSESEGFFITTSLEPGYPSWLPAYELSKEMEYPCCFS
jgi:hypothetical protein